MKSKYFVFLLICLLVLLPLIAGCQPTVQPEPEPEPEPDEEEEIGQTFKLSFITFWPPTDFQAEIGHQNWMDTIANRVKNETPHEIEWEPFYGTAPPGEYWQLVADGVYDVAATGTGYSPGIFPLWFAPELPADIPRANAYTMSLVKQALHDEMPVLQDEIETVGVKLMHLWSVGPGYFLMTPGKMIRTLEDFQGLTIRAATPAAAVTIAALGAEPLGVPMSAALEGFEAGTLDGIQAPTDVPKGFGLGSYVWEVTAAPFSYDFVFIKFMNPDKYNSLPASVQNIFDEVNAAWPAYYGQLRAWGESADGWEYLTGLEDFTYFNLPEEDPDEYARWVEATAPLIDGWIDGDPEKQAVWDKFVELNEYYHTVDPAKDWVPGAAPPPVPTFP
jgi:TRAP-type transport system periplasmic protein